MNNGKILVIGNGGLCKQVYPHIHSEIINDNIIFLDETDNTNTSYGCRLIKSFNDISKDVTHFIIAVSKPKNRQDLTKKCIDLGLTPLNLISEDVFIPNSCKLDDNLIILGKTLIEENVNIGYGCLINTRVTLSHNCKIDNFCEIAPSVTILGNVEIGNNTFIGAGAIIHPNIKIGSNVIIGAGSVIRGDVSDNLIVYTDFQTITNLNIL